MDQAGNAGTGTQSVDFVVLTPVVDTGPRVVGLQRFGVRELPNMLVLSFDRLLNAARAVNPRSYLVLGPGRDRRLGTTDDHPIPLSSGYYNSANRTVTLVMAKPLNLFRQYRIVVRGTVPTGITDVNGVPLDGTGDGNSGTNFTTTFGREILGGTPPATSPVSQSLPARVSGPARYRSFRLGNPYLSVSTRFQTGDRAGRALLELVIEARLWVDRRDHEGPAMPLDDPSLARSFVDLPDPGSTESGSTPSATSCSSSLVPPSPSSSAGWWTPTRRSARRPRPRR